MKTLDTDTVMLSLVLRDKLNSLKKDLLLKARVLDLEQSYPMLLLRERKSKEEWLMVVLPFQSSQVDYSKVTWLRSLSTTNKS